MGEKPCCGDRAAGWVSIAGDKPTAKRKDGRKRDHMSGIDIKPDAQGKVRDIYDLGDKLLMVATDRISAYDYILPDEIPHKGEVLTQLSCSGSTS